MSHLLQPAKTNALVRRGRATWTKPAPVVVKPEAEMLAQPGVSGIWLRTYLRREGTYWIATTYVVDRGNVELFTVKVNVRPIMERMLKVHKARVRKLPPGHRARSRIRKLPRGHRARVSGDEIGFGFSLKAVAKGAWNAGKSKVVKAAYNTSKSVVKSRITQGVVAATAVVYPPVGVPAAAALATANTALNYVEQGKKVADEAARVAGRLKSGQALKQELVRYGKKYGEQALKSYVNQNPQLKMGLKLAANFKAEVSTKLAPPQRRAQLKSTMINYRRGKAFLQRVSNAARFGKGQVRIDAQKMARVVAIAAANRRRIASLTTEIEGGIPGILIDDRGRMIRGNFALSVTGSVQTPDVLVTPGGAKTGQYHRVYQSPEQRQKIVAYSRLKQQVQRAQISGKAIRGRRRRTLARMRRRIANLPPEARVAEIGRLDELRANVQKRVHHLRS